MENGPITTRATVRAVTMVDPGDDCVKKIAGRSSEL
jgi:hypothetical protein